MALSQRRPRCYHASPARKGTSERPQNSPHGWGIIFHPSAVELVALDGVPTAGRSQPHSDITDLHLLRENIYLRFDAELVSGITLDVGYDVRRPEL